MFPRFERNAALFHERDTVRAGDVLRVFDALRALPAEAKIPAASPVVGKTASWLMVARHVFQQFSC